MRCFERYIKAKSALVWDTTQRRAVILYQLVHNYRCAQLVQNYRSAQLVQNYRSAQLVQNYRSAQLVQNYRSAQRNVPEER
jgi:hypothetical protein